MFKKDWEKTIVKHRIPDKVIEKITYSVYPNSKILFIDLIAGGCANINYKILLSDKEKPLILRIYLRDKDSAHKEKEIIKLLKSKLPITEIFHIGEMDNYTFAFCEFMPGITLTELILSGKDCDISQIMYDIGQVLGDISLSHLPKSEFSHILSPYDFIKHELKDDKLINILGSDNISKINMIFDKYHYLFDDHQRQYLVHGDFDPSNILVDEIDGKWQISAILDWEFSFIGSFLWDMANMLRYAHKMPDEFRTYFIKGFMDKTNMLPNFSWYIIIHLLNIISLVDCLKRTDLVRESNRYEDIIKLISYLINILETRKYKDIEMVEYNHNWPKIYEKEAELIKDSLADNYINIFHVGSTSIPGMLSKPKIDIIAEVKNGAHSIIDLSKIGYKYEGEWNIPFKYGFVKRGEINVNLHVFEKDNPEIELNLIFRDHMINNKEAFKQYAELKKYLLIKEESFYKKSNIGFTGYNLDKDDFIRNIIAISVFDKVRMLKCTHYKEWQEYNRIRKEQVHDNIDLVHNENNIYFILVKNVVIVAIAHLELLEGKEVALKFLAVDEPYKNQGFEKQMMNLLEKWIELRGLLFITRN